MPRFSKFLKTTIIHALKIPSIRKAGGLDKFQVNDERIALKLSK